MRLNSIVSIARGMLSRVPRWVQNASAPTAKACGFCNYGMLSRWQLQLRRSLIRTAKAWHPLKLLTSWRASSRWQQLAAAAWGVVLVVVSVRAVVSPHRHTVYPIFSTAARNWLAGGDLYVPQPGLDDYRYSPMATALMSPLGWLPDRLGGVLWRLFNAGVLLGALLGWTRNALPRSLTANQRAALFLLILPLTVGNLNNAQSNPLLLGLLLSAVTAAARHRWVVAAACIAVATGLKVYPIALGLLLALVLSRRFAVALVLALLGAIGLSFLLQEPGYVARQWGEWFRHVWAEDRQSRPLEFWYRDFRLLWMVWLGPIGPQSYRLTQMTVAASLAVICWAARRSRFQTQRDIPAERMPILVLGMSCCWMTVFGPATETSTYMLLAPSLAWALVEAWLEWRSLWRRGLLIASYGILLLGVILAWFPGMSRSFQTLGASPLAGLLLLVAVVWPELSRLRARGRRQLTCPVYPC